jgi:hypothetical protein
MSVFGQHLNQKSIESSKRAKESEKEKKEMIQGGMKESEKECLAVDQYFKSNKKKNMPSKKRLVSKKSKKKT